MKIYLNYISTKTYVKASRSSSLMSKTCMLWKIVNAQFFFIFSNVLFVTVIHSPVTVFGLIFRLGLNVNGSIPDHPPWKVYCGSSLKFWSWETISKSITYLIGRISIKSSDCSVNFPNTEYPILVTVTYSPYIYFVDKLQYFPQNLRHVHNERFASDCSLQI